MKTDTHTPPVFCGDYESMFFVGCVEREEFNKQVN